MNWVNNFKTTNAGQTNAGDGKTWFSAVGAKNFQSATKVSVGYYENLTAGCYYILANWQ